MEKRGAEAPPHTRLQFRFDADDGEENYYDQHYSDNTWQDLDLDVPPWQPLPPRDILEYSIPCGKLHVDCPPVRHAGGRTNTDIAAVRSAGAPVRIVCSWKNGLDTISGANQYDIEVQADLFRTIQHSQEFPLQLCWLLIDSEGRPVPQASAAFLVPETSPVTALTHTDPAEFDMDMVKLHWMHVAMVRFDELELPRLRRFNFGISVYWLRRKISAWDKGEVSEGHPLPCEDYPTAVGVLLTRDGCTPGGELHQLMQDIPDMRALRRVRF